MLWLVFLPFFVKIIYPFCSSNLNIFWLSQANAHFQGEIHQAKAWRSSYENTIKSVDEANAKITALEAKLGSTEADLEEARAARSNAKIPFCCP